MTFRRQVDVRRQTSHRLPRSNKDREERRLASSADSSKTHPFSVVDRSRHEVKIAGSQRSSSNNKSLQRQYHGLVAPAVEVNHNSERRQKEATTDLTSQSRHITLESPGTGMVYPNPSSKRTRPRRQAIESAANGTPQQLKIITTMMKMFKSHGSASLPTQKTMHHQPHREAPSNCSLSGITQVVAKWKVTISS